MSKPIQQLRAENLARWAGKFDKQADFLADIYARTKKHANQGELSLLARGKKSFGEVKARNIEKLAGMDPGYLDREHDGARQVVDAKVQANNDVVAVHLAMRSLITALTANVPAVAESFSALLREIAEEKSFDVESGLVSQVLRTVEQGQRISAAAVKRASQRDSESPPKLRKRG